MGILLTAALYVFVPDQSAFAMQISPDRQWNAAQAEEVIYGKASDMHGHPLAGVRVSIKTTDRHLRANSVSMVSGSDGTYRAVVRLPAGRYQVVASSDSGRNHHYSAASKSLRIAAGHSYNVSVKVVRRGFFSLMPMSTY